VTVVVTAGAGEEGLGLGAVARPTKPLARLMTAARTIAKPGGMSHGRLSACSFAVWAEPSEDEVDFVTGPL
jgi:hypothetical protein